MAFPNVKRPSFLVFICVTSVLLGSLCTEPCTLQTGSWLTTVLKTLLGLILVVLALASLDMAQMRISSFHSNQTGINHYLTLKSLSWFGWWMRRKLETHTQTCRFVQEKLLLDRLRQNAETVYGKEYKFADIRSCEDFVQTHPLTRYSHYEPYVQRLMKGEVNVLTKDRPVLFGVTSGTSGKSSILPMIRKQQGDFFFKGIAVVCQAMLEVYPDTYQLQKTLKFFYTPKWRTSEAGIPVGPNSSSPTNSGRLLTIYSTPKIAFEVLEEPKTLYLHLLFGLRDRNIGMLESNFASSIYTGFKALDVHWKQLAEDIEKGQVNPDLDIDSHIRCSLNELLSPDPKRAGEIRAAFSLGPVGLAKRLWPNCNMMLTTDTGTFALYGKMLEDTFCKGIPIFSCLYGATEGLLGINIWPKSKPARYLLVPTSMFYEFIPEEDTDEEQPQTLFIDQVKVGCVYELVITNVSGLCRYRFGDVVKVTDFYNTCPVIEFMYRQGQFLNVHSEKTSEMCFYKALTSAVSKWPGVQLMDYCCAESVLLQKGSRSAITPYYVVFLELEGSEGNMHTVKTQLQMVDEALCELSYVYKSYRLKNSIGPMEVHLVQPGSFQGLRQFTLDTQNASSNQYKVPRVLKNESHMTFLMDRVLC